MLQRVTFLFQQTTAPPNLAEASPRTSGWSEGFWTEQDLTDMTGGRTWIGEYLRKRAPLLGQQAAVVGCRIAVYEISGNKLIPKGSQTRKFHAPGFSGSDCDVPQLALMFSGTAEDSVNLSRFAIRGIPDNIVKNGEFRDLDGWGARCRLYMNAVSDGGWGFIGRDLTQPLFTIRKIENSRLYAPTGPMIVPNQSYLRLHKVKDVNGDTISGSYRVTDWTGGVNGYYLLEGLDPALKSDGPGSYRLDQIRFCNFDKVDIDSVVVRKVGRPFKGYRGRASKR